MQISNGLEEITQKASKSASKINHNYDMLDINNREFVTQLYDGFFQREADSIGMNYWLGQLNSRTETRYEVLMGFSESPEYKALFTDITGFG